MAPARTGPKTAGAAPAAYLEADEPSPITYKSEPKAEVRDADEKIQELIIAPAAIEIEPVEEMFARGPS